VCEALVERCSSTAVTRPQPPWLSSYGGNACVRRRARCAILRPCCRNGRRRGVYRRPSYREIARTGPHHDPEFLVAVDLAEFTPAEGVGRSKRAAEQAAAAAMLTREGVQEGVEGGSETGIQVEATG